MCLNKLIDKTSNEIKLQIKNVATCKNTKNNCLHNIISALSI